LDGGGDAVFRRAAEISLVAAVEPLNLKAFASA
jgi:hypothetical protein